MSIFVVPIAGTGARGDPFRPKYVKDLPARWLWIPTPLDWGVAWANASPAQETAIGANADAIVVPPLDNTIALVATQNALEGLNVPAHWLTAGMTYRTVVRVVVGMACFVQRCDGLGQRVTLAGNLNSQISTFSVGVRNTLAAASDSLGLDRSQVTGTTTLREAMRIAGQQFATGTVIQLGDL